MDLLKYPSFDFCMDALENRAPYAEKRLGNMRSSAMMEIILMVMEMSTKT